MPQNPPLDDIPEEAAFLAADRGADRISKGIRQAFLAALSDTVAGLDQNALRAATSFGDSGYAESIVRAGGLGARFTDNLKDSGAKAERESSLLDQAIEIGLILGLAVLAVRFTTEQVEEFRRAARVYAETELRDQAKWIEDETAAALALALFLVRRAPFVSEKVSGALARVFEPQTYRATIGLNKKQVQGLIRRGRSSLIAGVPVEAVRRQVFAEAAVLLNERAELVARSIAERAINLSQQAAVERAALLGLIDADEVYRQWISRADGEVCQRCLDFHLVLARIDEPFISRTGEIAWVPDVHPFGRCRFRVAGIAA